MKFSFNGKKDTIVLPVFEDVEISNDIFTFLKEKELFQGKAGESYFLQSPEDSVLFVGLGKKDEICDDDIRVYFHTAGKELDRGKVKEASVFVDGLEDKLTFVYEGLKQAEYNWNKFKTDEKNKKFNLEEVSFEIEETDERRKELEEIDLLMDGVFFARDLVNEPADILTPTELALRAEEELKKVGVEVEILGEKEIRELGMEAFWAVAKGSDEEPKFIIMTYNGGKENDPRLGLVGKGLTYDSGGYSIKPARGMETMHCDMGGAGAVIGAMKAIASAKLEKNVTAVVASCENLISGKAFKTGDIIGSMAGKTIDVGNTDAEGRLTLADALYYMATVVKPDHIVEMATLTGAVLVALSDITTGAVTNNKDFLERVEKASKVAGEPIWELPNNKHYKKLIESPRADLSNTGRAGAGTITAALFLEEFVEELPWVHLDIAGTAYLDKGRGYLPVNATGNPVKTIFYLTKDY